MDFFSTPEPSFHDFGEFHPCKGQTDSQVSSTIDHDLSEDSVEDVERKIAQAYCPSKPEAASSSKSEEEEEMHLVEDLDHHEGRACTSLLKALPIDNLWDSRLVLRKYCSPGDVFNSSGQ